MPRNQPLRPNPSEIDVGCAYFKKKYQINCICIFNIELFDGATYVGERCEEECVLSLLHWIVNAALAQLDQRCEVPGQDGLVLVARGNDVELLED